MVLNCAFDIQSHILCCYFTLWTTWLLIFTNFLHLFILSLYEKLAYFDKFHCPRAPNKENSTDEVCNNDWVMYESIFMNKQRGEEEKSVIKAIKVKELIFSVRWMHAQRQRILPGCSPLLLLEVIVGRSTTMLDESHSSQRWNCAEFSINPSGHSFIHSFNANRCNCGEHWCTFALTHKQSTTTLIPYYQRSTAHTHKIPTFYFRVYQCFRINIFSEELLCWFHFHGHFLNFCCKRYFIGGNFRWMQWRDAS